MRRFCDLYDALDQTTSTNAKVAALAAHFATRRRRTRRGRSSFSPAGGSNASSPPQACGPGRRRRPNCPSGCSTSRLSAAGDFGELVALALDAIPPGPPEPELTLADWVEQRLMPLQRADPAQQRAYVIRWWLGLPRLQRFILNKLLTGEFRVGVAQTLVTRALAGAIGGMSRPPSRRG